jgi:carbamate kinase
LAVLGGWQIRQDGTAWRLVVASPEPLELVELATIRALSSEGIIVVCAGGGGVPVCRDNDGRLRGMAAVVDKDLTAALLARDLGADALLLLTDVPGVELGFGTEAVRTLRHTSPPGLRAQQFAAGSMGPKAEAACRFVEATGNKARIGLLDDAVDLLAGTKGTVVEPAVDARATEPVPAGP